MADIGSSSSGQLPQPRQQFSNRLEKYAIFLSLTCDHSHCLRFVTYALHNGLLSWIIVYAVTQLLIGIPLFTLEYFVGQFTSSSMINMYSVAPALKGAGITCVLFMLAMLSYGAIFAGKNLVVLAYTFTMSWMHCDNVWNTPQCQMYNNSVYNLSGTEILYGSSQQFSSEVLSTGTGSVFMWWLALAAVVVWILGYFTVVNGTRIMGKVALYIMVFRVVVTIILLIVGLSFALTNGGYHALEVYFSRPSYELGEKWIWMTSMMSIFTMQSSLLGILTTLGSYDKLHNNCLIDVSIIAAFSLLYPFIYGIFIMAILGFLSNIKGLDLNDVYHSEFELGQIPLALSMIPGNFLWVFLYVLMTFAAKFGYFMVILEVIITSLMDENSKTFIKRQGVALGICVPFAFISMIYCIGNGIGNQIFMFFHSFIVYLGTWGNMSWIVFTFVYLYGAGRMVRDIRHILPRISWAVTWPCYLSWIIIIPIAYAVSNHEVYSYKSYFVTSYPDWLVNIGEFVISAVLWFTTIYAIVYLILTKGTFCQRLRSGFRPSADWGPKESEAKLAWQEYCKKRPMCCGCLHPDCCNPTISEADDVAIPLRVVDNSNPEQPTAFPDAGYPRMPTAEKPEVTKPEEGLYPDLPTTR